MNYPNYLNTYNFVGKFYKFSHKFVQVIYFCIVSHTKWILQRLIQKLKCSIIFERNLRSSRRWALKSTLFRMICCRSNILSCQCMYDHSRVRTWASSSQIRTWFKRYGKWLLWQLLYQLSFSLLTLYSLALCVWH